MYNATSGYTFFLVHQTKMGTNNAIERYKACLVVSGSEQLFEVDCTLMFAAIMD